MSDKSKINLGLINAELPKSVDNALLNVTDTPTKNIGNTLADIWFLVFGGISHTADKRKMKYAKALEDYQKSLVEKIEHIPHDNLIEPDLQIIAPAFEASKYCIEKSELRNMFVNLIVASIDSQKEGYVHPIFTDIIRRLSAFDAKLLKMITTQSFDNDLIYKTEIDNLSFSISIIRQLGLIDADPNNTEYQSVLQKLDLNYQYKNNVTILNSERAIVNIINSDLFDITLIAMKTILKKYIAKVNANSKYLGESKQVEALFTKGFILTPLGQQFKKVCFE